MPAFVMLVLVTAFYAACVGLAMLAGHSGRNVDEVRGLEEQMDPWKT